MWNIIILIIIGIYAWVMVSNVYKHYGRLSTAIIVTFPALAALIILYMFTAPFITNTFDSIKINHESYALREQIEQQIQTALNDVNNRITTNDLEKLKNYIVFSEGAYFRVGYIFDKLNITSGQIDFAPAKRKQVVGDIYQHTIGYSDQSDSIVSNGGNPGILDVIQRLSKFFIVDNVSIVGRETYLYMCPGREGWSIVPCKNPIDRKTVFTWNYSLKLLQYEYGKDPNIKNVDVDVYNMSGDKIDGPIKLSDALEKYGQIGGVVIVKAHKEAVNNGQK